MTQPSVTSLLTVDEAREIAARTPNRRYELHQGELVEMTVPKYNHRVIQKQVDRLLSAKTAEFGLVFTECGFRGTAEYDIRVADVALLSRARHLEALQANELFGAPELVVEVISPSNRAGEMDEKEAFCFASGCRCFWLINPVRRTVKVSGAAGHTVWYNEADSIPLTPFAQGSILVAEIFTPLT